MPTFRRPSAALIVATTALVVAIGGTTGASAIGAIVQKISGSDLVANSVTGVQVKESTLGIVPKAAVASNALALGGLAPTSVVHGDANDVAFRVVEPANTKTFTLFSLQDGGLFTAACSSGPQPGLTFVNHTGHDQDMSLTVQNSGAPDTITTYGPPFLNDTGIANEVTASDYYVTAISSTTPYKTADLTIQAGVDKGTCFWTVQGTSSLSVTR